jgi:putative DNA-invertase from lambdoid prophage Rac
MVLPIVSKFVAAKLNRLGRDALKVFAAIKSPVVLQVRKVDLTSADGKLLMTMLAAVAEMERDRIAERTQPGLARARADGKVLGRPAAQCQAIVEGQSAKQSASALGRRHEVSRSTILAIVKAPA